MTDLMGSDRTTQERKDTLASYLKSPDALRELATTLNMRSYRDWNYRNAHVGLQVDARKTIQSQHYVNVETDVVDMLFIHCCAVSWAMKLNEYLQNFVRESSIFSPTPLAAADIDKRSFFLDNLAPPQPFMCGTMAYPCPPPLPQFKTKKSCTASRKTMQFAPPMPPMPPMYAGG
ncbi:hypothetical protein G6011_03908 [Alternaria panax]|uniref:Uncharacterized protein n=1 Tax=Alternaria panax TaxID=48097 RepID=A0AAD4IG87_9PLEO|nr:hypothetical protein G6011_03908 [Alternaria panax]